MIGDSFSDTDDNEESKLKPMTHFISPDRSLGTLSSNTSEDDDDEEEEKKKISLMSKQENKFNFRNNYMKDKNEKRLKLYGFNKSSEDSDNLKTDIDRTSSSTSSILSNTGIKSNSFYKQTDRYNYYSEMNSSQESEPKNEMTPNKKLKIDVEYETSLKKPLGYNKGRDIMLRQMGYVEGQGLGKHSQGITNPVEASTQKGRSGLGHSAPALDEGAANWNKDEEDVSLDEAIYWLDGSYLDSLNMESLRNWKQEGCRNNDIASMRDFVDGDILDNILASKSSLDKISDSEFPKIRNKCNPFELIKGRIFMNRAAMKMANMDYAFDFMFTSPKDIDDKYLLSDKELLYFADVCAGPGGFSEYVLWKKNWRAKGIGFTLKNENDFKLTEFYAGSSETFEAYYGENGDGNIYDSQNISSLTQFVLKSTDDHGVHFMMADGGFSVKDNENIQELLSKQLYLTQFLVALSIVRKHGHFVCKLFDIFSPFSVGLVYLMYRSFKKICIFKPNTSRPANSERYIICKWKRGDCVAIKQYMMELNDTLNELGSESKTDVIGTVPLDIIKSDEKFFDYIYESNNRLGKRQVNSLRKIAAFYTDPTLVEMMQHNLVILCLQKWGIPNELRKTHSPSPNDMVKKILGNDSDFLRREGKKLLKENMGKYFIGIFDWHCQVLGCREKMLHFFLSLGKGLLYKCSLMNGKWDPVPDNFALTPGTLVYGEIVTNFNGEGGSKLKKLHIFDAITLGYEDISHKRYEERYKLCCLYEKALKKQTVTNFLEIKVMESIPLEKSSQIFERLTYRESKKTDNKLMFEGDGYCYPPKGVLFFRIVCEPWLIAFSRSYKKYYYYNSQTKESVYEPPHDSLANVKYCVQKQILWWWDHGVGIKGELPVEDVIHKDEFLSFIKKKSINKNI